MVLETRLATFETVAKTDQKKIALAQEEVHELQTLASDSFCAEEGQGRVGGVNLLVSGESLTSSSRALSTGAGAEPI